FWNRYDKFAAPGADIGQLIGDLVFEVPRQYQYVVGFGFADLLRREDGNVGAWQILAVLVGIAINRVVEEVGADAAICSESVPLPARAIADVGLPRALSLDQNPEQFALRCADLVRELGICLEPMQPGILLATYQLSNPGQSRVSLVVRMANVDAQ